MERMKMENFLVLEEEHISFFNGVEHYIKGRIINYNKLKKIANKEEKIFLELEFIPYDYPSNINMEVEINIKKKHFIES